MRFPRWIRAVFSPGALLSCEVGSTGDSETTQPATDGAEASTTDGGSSSTGPSGDTGSAEATGPAEDTGQGEDTGQDGIANLAFVTSTLHAPPTLGGVAGGDRICNERAAEAGLPGTYVAWLSSSTVAARDRPELVAARGWMRTDGMPLVDVIAPDVGSVLHPLWTDEHGEKVDVDTYVVTATDQSGRVPPYSSTCEDYTDLAETGISGGWPDAVGRFWTDGVTASCIVELRLYCLGIDHDTPLVYPRAEGRLAFLSDSTVGPWEGRDRADEVCALDAAREGLDGEFLALMATPEESAIARFDLEGAPWVRTDGIAWVADASDLTRADLLTAMDVGPDGESHLYGHEAVLTGALGFDLAGTDATTCRGWTSNAEADEVEWGSPLFADPQAFANSTRPCSYEGLLFCLER